MHFILLSEFIKSPGDIIWPLPTDLRLMMEYTQLTLGKPIDLDMPPESMCILLINGAPVLFFNFALTENNINAFYTGKTSFGLFAENTMLFFLYKIGGFLDWSDLAFTIHLSRNEYVDDTPCYLPFHLVLVDSASSLIKGIRMVTVSPAYRALLTEVIKKQVNGRFDTLAYYKHIRAIYDAYPTVPSMLSQALIIEEGGKTFGINKHQIGAKSVLLRGNVLVNISITQTVI